MEHCMENRIDSSWNAACAQAYIYPIGNMKKINRFSAS